MKGFMALLLAIGLCLCLPLCWSEEAPKPAPPVKSEGLEIVPGRVPPKAEVVDWQEIVKFVPEALEGWKAAKPVGKTQRVGPFAVATVSRMFTKDGLRIEFRMEDLGTNNPYFFMKEPWKTIEQKTDEVYTKKLMLGKVAAEETYRTKEKLGLVFAVFERRIQLNISGYGVENTSLLIDMAKKINFEELAKVLKEKSK